jgi:hypothetical protein
MMLGTIFCNICDFSEELMERVDRWTAPLFVLFFVLSGAELELSVFTDVMIILIGVVYIISRSAGKYSGALFSAKLSGCDDNIVKYLGITLLPQAGVALGMAMKSQVLGLELGSLISSITLFAVLIYELIGPLLTKIALQKAGEIDPEGILKVKTGKSVTYTITPDEGYEIEAVYVDGKDIGAVEEYTFKNVKKDHTILAEFAEIEDEVIDEAIVDTDELYFDVDADDWFYDDVAFVTENGLMNGMGGGLFVPEAATTRAMIVTVLWRLEGEAEAESAGFTDVAADMWYTEAIDWAAANGIVLGYGDGTFGPENNITREQVMAILNRYAAFKGWDDGIAVTMIPQYNCSVWAENNVNWADMNGILADLGVDVYDMTAEADRAEIAAYFTRFCLNVAE